MKVLDALPSLEDLTQFSPVACLECRNHHRKCDKKKPKCDACEIRGFSCTYSKTMKRKLKKHIIHNNLEEDCNMIEFYYNLASYGLPMVEREELNRFVALIAEHKGEIPDKYPNGYDNQDQLYEMAALFYSIKAICESFTGTMENAEKAASKSKEYLCFVFDRHSSLLVTACYYYLCCFDLMVGRVESSQFYHQILRFNKEKFKNRTNLSNLERNAYECICYVDDFMFDEQGNIREMTFELHLQIIPRIYIFDKDNLPSGWDFYLKNPHLIDSVNCLEVCTMVEMILRESRENDLRLSPGFSQLTNLYYNMTENGFRVALLVKSSNTDSPMIQYSLESSTSAIVEATMHPQFKSLPLEIMIYVSLAANYHLEKVKSGILFSKKGSSHYEFLSKELIAYYYFKKKFSITAYHFEKVFVQIEKILNQAIVDYPQFLPSDVQQYNMSIDLQK